MKPFLPGFCRAAFLFLVASPLVGHAHPPLATPHPELSQPDRFSKPPIGILGLPLGTFAVIEGTRHPTGKSWGPDDLVIESLNGEKVGRDLRLRVEWLGGSISGQRVTLHGYEKGRWEGQPEGLPREEPSGRTQQAMFSFRPLFAVTSVEKMDGVTVAAARPLDPHVSLAKPDLAARPDSARPMGILGLPLGTFAIIQASNPHRPVLLESPFEVDRINGRPLDHPPVLTIRGVPEIRGGGPVTLHGFETGAWEGEPDLPKSENPSGNQAQQPFQFHHEFVVTSVVKSAVPASSPAGP